MNPHPDLTPDQLRTLMRADFTFSEQQFEAITAPLEPGVVIAGAGSGKTAVMAARVVWLVATGRVRPDQVLGLTFTTKATAELAGRVRAALLAANLLDPEAEEPTVSTYNAYAAALLSEHGLRIGHEPDSRLILDGPRYQLAARVVSRHRQPVHVLSDYPPLVIQQLLALDAQLAEHLIEPHELLAYDERERRLFEEPLATEHRKTYRDENERAIKAIDGRRELAGLVQDYRDLKKRLGLIDFSDQIALAAALARDHADVGACEREKFRVVLLDEYQDTSVAQAIMLSRLFPGHPVTAVGDPNQAIYGWRGASVSNIVQFGRDFPAAHGEPTRFGLSVNRRSDRHILDVANALAEPLYAQGNAGRPLEAKPEAGDGVVNVIVHETYDDELQAIADEVLRLHARPVPVPWREMAVLTRSNAHAADVFDALTARDIPVEIVGLKGLLRLPEVAEVVAMLTLINDVTANASLLTLLTGPRWAIGPRDLALLGRRARELAGDHGRSTAAAGFTAALAAAVRQVEVEDFAALSDALVDPGDAAYSPEARQRFSMLADELRRLRAAAHEPLLDLVRRVIEVSGLDVELASSTSRAASARRDNLDLFVQAVGEFQAYDGQVSLAALVSWLETEDEQGQGLDVATPSEADSVKLLTVHRAKGLEWDVVFVPGVTESKFPSSTGRSTWLTSPAVLPHALRGDAVDLPELLGHTPDDIKAFKKAYKQHEATEELRLAYVGWTRARHLLTVSCWRWRSDLKRGLGPSPYLQTTRDALEAWDAQPIRWAEKPDAAQPHPLTDVNRDVDWPRPHRTLEVERREVAAARVLAALAEADDGVPEPMVEDLTVLERIHEWDQAWDQLRTEALQAREGIDEVRLPATLSATALTRVRDDREGFLAELARPMPQRPMPTARLGTRFHAWVESRLGQPGLLDPDDLPGRLDTDVADEADLSELMHAFENGPFADRVPVAVEAPFSLVLGDRVIRGRVDAVYRDDGEGLLVVDWKTHHHESADPLQLAVYRLAMAELHGLPVDQVRAGFHYVRSGRTVFPSSMPDRDELESALTQWRNDAGTGR